MREAVRAMMKEELGELGFTAMLRDIEKIDKYYNAYQYGLDWDSLQLEMDYKPTKKKSNKIKQLIKDEARFLFGKPPEVKILADKPEEAEILQKYIDDTFRKNIFPSKLLKGAKDCFIGKRVALKLCGSQDGESIKIMFLPATAFLFEPVEDDVDELQKIIFFYCVHEDTDSRYQRLWRQKYEMIGGKCILNEGIYDGNGQLLEVRYTNYDTGLLFIPAYVIVNDGLSGDYTGESDVADLLDNQMEYNRLVSEDIDTLRKGMNQIIYGTDIDGAAIEHFKIKPGAFWDVPTDPSRAENGSQAAIGIISNDFAYDLRIEHALKRIENEMYASLSVPNVTPAELQGFITSGKAMKALYWQLMARCQEKFMDWEPAISWMVWAILSMSRTLGMGGDLPESKGFMVKVENQFPLPEDEAEKKTADLAEVTASITSRKRYLEKWIVKDADEALAELEQLERESTTGQEKGQNTQEERSKEEISKEEISKEERSKEERSKEKPQGLCP